MRDEDLKKIANTMVMCPDCREMFTVSAGWFFADNPTAPRYPKQANRTYLSSQVAGDGRYVN